MLKPEVLLLLQFNQTWGKFSTTISSIKSGGRISTKVSQVTNCSEVYAITKASPVYAKSAVARPTTMKCKTLSARLSCCGAALSKNANCRRERHAKSTAWPAKNTSLSLTAALL